MANAELVNSIKDYIRAEPRHFSDVVEAYRQYPYREVLYVWSDIRGAGLFVRDREGHYLLKEE